VVVDTGHSVLVELDVVLVVFVVLSSGLEVSVLSRCAVFVRQLASTRVPFQLELSVVVVLDSTCVRCALAG
jgi:hypothetical protein